MNEASGGSNSSSRKRKATAGEEAEEDAQEKRAMGECERAENAKKEIERQQQAASKFVFQQATELPDPFAELKNMFGRQGVEKWIRENQETAETIKKKLMDDERHEERLSDSQVTTLSPAEITKTSCSVVLRALGFRNGEWIRSNSNLLKIRDNDELSFLSPNQAEERSQKEFFSQQEESRSVSLQQCESYQAAVEFRGSHAINVGKAPFQGSRNEDKTEHHEEHSSMQYYCRCNVLRIPTKAFQLQPEQLTLSDEAITELCKIEQQLRATGSAQESINKFCQRFGTHGSYGIFHLGGTYITKVTFQSHSNEEQDTVKSLVTSVLDASVRIGIGHLLGVEVLGKLLKYSGTADKEFSKSQLSHVKVSTIKYGGPTEASSERFWKVGISRSNQDWRVIECGKERIPIWELIKSCKSSFKEASALADKFCHLLEPECEGPSRQTACEDFELFLDEFHLETSEVTPADWASLFKALLGKIRKLESFTENDNKGIVWQSYSNKLTPIFAAFVQQSGAILQSDEGPIIKCYLSDLLATTGEFGMPKEAEIKSLVNETASEEAILSKHTFSDPQQMIDFLQNQVIPSIKGQEGENVSDEVHGNLTIGMQDLLQSLSADGKHRTRFVVCLTLMSHSFSPEQNGFDIRLTHEAIRRLAEGLQNNLNRQSDIEQTNYQEYIDARMLKMMIEHRNEHSIDENYQFMIKHCNIEWTPSLKCILDETSYYFNWSELSAGIRGILNGYTEDGERLTVRNFALEKSVIRSASNSFLCVDSLLPAEKLLLKGVCLEAKLRDPFSFFEVSVLNGQHENHQAIGKSRELPRTFLECVLIGDHTSARTITKLQLDSELNIQESSTDDSHGWPDDNSDTSTESASASDSANSLHHSDIVLASFLCCDARLQQLVAEKLHECKMGIPFACQLGGKPRLLVWPISSCRLMFNHARSNRYKEISVDSDSFPVISVIRLGHSTFSKSKIINLCIHRHLEVFSVQSDVTCQRQISHGSIELTWLLPSRSETESQFEDAACVLNLRGDATQLPQQRQFLSAVSSCIIVLLHENEHHDDQMIVCLEELYRNCQMLIVMIESESKSMPKCLGAIQKSFGKAQFREKMWPIWLMKEQARLDDCSVARHLKSNICKLQARGMKEISVEKMIEHAKTMEWIIDEQQPDMITTCRNTKALMEEFQSANNSFERSNTPLPLQGELWKQLAELEKKLNRDHGNLLGNERINWIDKVKQDINNIRLRQRGILDKQLTNSSSFIIRFIQFFQDAARSAVQTVFLQKLKINLDSLCRKRTNVQTRQHENGVYGLEHLFRELGQAYETLAGSKSQSEEQKNNLEQLASIGSDSLLHGFALEVIDGDATAVPIVWVNAVLKSVEAKIGKMSLRVVSVLGVQSSGKSTLLNTMFGLQFPVSAGRCTRGAFMQLVKNDVSKSGLQADYVIVIDTEGLRAPELGSGRKVRDNELATMAIGLADVAVINIMGESFSEISDVLQIVVHAFLRMRNVFQKLEHEKACIFIHQNVTAVDAKNKTLESKRYLQSELDSVVTEAAKEEGVPDVKQFSDIISFNPEENVIFLPHLWDGEPPTAAVNPAYSRDVQHAKFNIVTLLKKLKGCRLVFSELADRISDLWKAVLEEDFVFSFQNTLELTAFKELESECSELKFTLQRDGVQWVDSNGMVMIRQCEDEDQLNEIFAERLNAMEANFNESGERAIERLKNFFKESKRSNIIIKWRQQKLNILELDLTMMKRENQERLQYEKEERRVHLQNKEDRHRHFRNVMNEARIKATEIRLGTPEDELKTKFGEFWQRIRSRVLPRSVPAFKIANYAERALREYFRDQTKLLNEQIDHFRTQPDVRSKFSKLEYSLRMELFQTEARGLNQSMIFTYMNGILRQIDDTVLAGSNDKKPTIDSSAFTSIIRLIGEEISKYNDKPKCGSLPTNLKILLSVHACLHAESILIDRYEFCEQRDGVRASFEACKPAAFLEFKSHFKRENEDVKSANLVACHIMQVIREAAEKEVSKKIVEFLIKLGGKHVNIFKARLMKSLLENEYFGDYITFINRPHDFAVEWMERQIKYIFFPEDSGNLQSKISEDSWKERQSNYSELMLSQIEKLIEISREPIHASTMYLHADSSIEPKNVLNAWINKFCALEKRLGFGKTSFQLMSDNFVTNLITFETSLLHKLGSMNREARSKYKHLRYENAHWHGPEPHKLAVQYLFQLRRVRASRFGLGHCLVCNEYAPNSNESKHFSGTSAFLTPDLHEGSDICLELKEGRLLKNHQRPLGIRGIIDEDSEELALYTCLEVFQKKTLTKSDGSIIAMPRSFDEIGFTFRTTLNSPSHHFMDASPYWKWFMSRFSDSLAGWYDKKMPELLPSWLQTTREDALCSIRY